jgi:hypothetical protein
MKSLTRFTLIVISRLIEKTMSFVAMKYTFWGIPGNPPYAHLQRREIYEVYLEYMRAGRKELAHLERRLQVYIDGPAEKMYQKRHPKCYKHDSRLHVTRIPYETPNRVMRELSEAFDAELWINERKCYDNEVQVGEL